VSDNVENIRKEEPLLEGYPLNEFPPYLMNRIMGRYNQSLRQEMASQNLTTAKMRVLAVLSAIEDILISELAVYAVVEQSTLSRALDQLSNEGLLKRKIDSIDTRATRVSLTKGLKAFQALWPHMLKSHNGMFLGIDTKEKKQFTITLQKILTNIRKHPF
jgi:DNA-binding MarR family transcriptional regulator